MMLQKTTSELQPGDIILTKTGPNDKVIRWLTSDDTGTSSKAIVMVMNGVQPSSPFGLDHPHDPADLGRCLRMLLYLPEYRERLSEMKAVSPVWSALVDNWDELASLLYEELPSGRAPKCYQRMKEIILANNKKF